MFSHSVKKQKLLLHFLPLLQTEAHAHVILWVVVSSSRIDICQSYSYSRGDI